MAQKTFANGRGIAHGGSGGMSVVFPDVCLTPTPSGPVPIPYPNIAQSADTSGGPPSVTCDGEMPMTKGATYSKSSGDEAGSAGGVASGVNRDAAEFMLYSFDVKFEGQGVCRLGDPLFHNAKNTMG
ncbi:hypothetical protein PPSIR1_18942 [Plesiocystis pacifica SIR-1]|uniref:Uncharacterized protein n=1 Tax=Plesiocystis pacifica SIR-1 TaxID=391625 RepID=A6GGK5_9BACT|nr:DUF4150 domain-containing protein [Plesiocystis pacifica]EDM74965.1 hypothetical protein PPSIR1_18942 [Plesiocystis pacifica SIR-1]